MAFRFMQIFLPEEADSNVDELLEGRDVLGTWRDAVAENRLVIHLLVPAEETEPIMDRFEQAYADTDGFRVVLFPVEAVLPRPKAADDEKSVTDEAEKEPKESIQESGRVSREELYSDIAETLGINRVFVAMTILSAIVAAVGLMRNDVAIIIGAMVIAPLLGPNVALSLSTTLGDLNLLGRALITNLIGVTLAFIISLVLGLTFSIDPNVPAIASRSSFALSDLALALAAGSAGTFAFTRGLSGAVIGVMVAVALMPPLVTFGLLLGAGHFSYAFGALMQFLANVVCINLAGVATFIAQGVRPRTWWEADRASKASWIAIVTWTVLLVILGVIVFSLQNSESAVP